MGETNNNNETLNVTANPRQIPKEWEDRMNQEFENMKDGLSAEEFENSLVGSEIDVTDPNSDNSTIPNIPKGVPVMKENGNIPTEGGNERLFQEMMNSTVTGEGDDFKNFMDVPRQDENLLGITSSNNTGMKVTYQTKEESEGRETVPTSGNVSEKKPLELEAENKDNPQQTVVNTGKLELTEEQVTSNNSMNIGPNDFFINNSNSTLSELDGTFEEEVEDKEKEEIVEKETDYSSPKAYLDSIKVDLNNIDVIDSDALSNTQSFEFILNNKSKTQTIAVQSGYKAYMEGLNYDEMTSLTNSSLDDYSSRLLLLQIIHSKINTTSIGKMNFDTWTRKTSYFDLESFIFGSYLESFPGNTKFSVRCGHCDRSVDANVNNDTLVRSKNPETDERVREISSLGDTRSLLQSSVLYKKKRIILPNSKIIVDIKIPSIRRYLDLMGSLNPKSREKLSNILSIMIYVEGIYMLDLKVSMTKKSPKYFQIIENDRIARTIARLDFADSKFLLDTINDYMALFQTVFSIKSFICPHCKKPLGDIPVDLEVLLFTQILQLS